MADKTYKMLVTLSNGSTIDAGTFVAPQGPKGDAGTIPEALPQEAGALKSGSLPTTGWTATVLPLWEGDFSTSASSGARIILPPNSLDFNKLKQYTHTTDWQIWTDYDWTSNTYQTPRYANAFPDEIRIGSDNVSFKIKPDGSLYAYNQDSSRVYFKGLKCLANSKYTFSISDTSITANSDVLMELTDNGGVKPYSMEAGSITVIRDTVPTNPIPYTYKVKQTNASGQFTLVNHFVPSIPESPTSLPVSYKKVSGELPTTGWESANVSWTGNVTSGANYNYLKFVTNIAGSYATNEIFYKTTYDNLLKSATVARTGNGPIGDGATRAETGDYKLYAEEQNAQIHIVIYDSGNIYYSCQHGDVIGTYALTELSVTSSRKTYSITDTDITANTSVKMYLTDEGGVKAQSKASGSITVIRDTVPTSAIPYEYEVEQTSAEGLFEVINAYVPTKTSELTNDSGFITAADIPSAGAWSDIVESATLTEDGLYEFDAVKNNKHYTSLIEIATGISAVGASAYSPARLSAKKLTSDTVLFQNTAGTITVTHINTEIDLEAASITETRTNISFKYRKIN